MFTWMADLVGQLFKVPKVKLVSIEGMVVTIKCSGTDPADVHIYAVTWGDGKVNESDSETRRHSYEAAGTYLITVRERCPLWVFRTASSKPLSVTVPGEAE
jgi:hypothetical protein